jgi:hypothetical protein
MKKRKRELQELQDAISGKKPEHKDSRQDKNIGGSNINDSDRVSNNQQKPKHDLDFN